MPDGVALPEMELVIVTLPIPFLTTLLYYKYYWQRDSDGILENS